MPGILLIAGPPGLGKTTLVHAVAEATGFTLLEINASDERSAGNGLQDKIMAAMSADSFGKNERLPNMILLDEIDGAASTGDKSIISLIWKLLKKPLKGDAEEADEDIIPEAPKLNRPIVCVCNDLYAPVLRPLRLSSDIQVISLKPAQPNVVASRLKQICEKEDLKLSSRILLELAELLHGDIRACLHCLQFYSRTAKKFESEASIRASLLSIAATAKEHRGAPHWQLLDMIFDGRMNRSNAQLVQAMYAEESYEKLLISAFEAYPQRPRPFHDDSRLTKLTTALDWLVWQQGLSSSISSMKLQSAYAPFTLVKLHRCFASASYQTNKSEKDSLSDYDQHLKEKRNSAIISSFRSGLHPRVRALWQTDSNFILITDILPAIQRKLSACASFRTANIQLLKPEEHAQLREIESLMIQAGLRFRLHNGEGEMKLEPPIDQLAFGIASEENSVPSAQQMARLAHNNSIRQMINATIERALILNEQPKVDTASRQAEYQKAYSSMFNKHSLSQVEKLEGPAKKTRVDFFGRPIAEERKKENQDQENLADNHQQVEPKKWWYHYNEGFTNAIRRPIHIKDLFMQPK